MKPALSRGRLTSAGKDLLNPEGNLSLSDMEHLYFGSTRVLVCWT
jgi:hypothetical protein